MSSVDILAPTVYSLHMTNTQTDSPTVLDITGHDGIAGQISYTATVQYGDEAPGAVTFVGSIYDGPIVMVLPSGVQTFVSTGVTDRIGRSLTLRWVRRFFGACEQPSNNHSGDIIAVYRGRPYAEIMCGYHASQL